MQPQTCSRCDQMLMPGEEKYVVSIKVSSDSDSDDDHGTAQGGDSELSWLFSEQCEDDCADDDHAPDGGRLAFTLCKKCREAFLRNPLNLDSPKGLLSMRLH